MADTKGTHKELATSSYVDEAAETTLTLSDLPSELILRIASLLEVGDLLALRRSNRFIYNISQDKLLWRGILRDLRLPLPRTLRSSYLEDLSHPELEKAVLKSYMVERRWLERRHPYLMPLTGDRQTIIRLLQLLDDRWVISIRATGLPAIWDILEDPPQPYKLSESASHCFQDGAMRAVAAVDPHQGDVIIGFRSIGRLPQVVRVHMGEPESNSFQLTPYGAIDHMNPHIPTPIALEPSRNTMITEVLGDGIQISDWIRNRTVEVTTSGPNDDHVFLLLGARLVGDYILLFMPMRMDLLLIPPSPDTDGQSTSENPNRHRFHLKYPGGHFTGASLSEPQPNPESPDDSSVVYVLAHSTTTGFFYFRVTIHNPDYTPSGPRARLDVDLVGVYELRKPELGRRGMFGPCLALRSWLGPEGKRGVWIERPLSALVNFVVAVSFDQSCPEVVPVELGDDLGELCEIAPRIESTGDVFIVDTWNPHDEIVRCSFSEATGKIVLGTRDNRIILL